MKKLTAILLVCVFLAGCAQRVVFTDVPEDSPLAKSVERLAKRGILDGILTDTLCPDQTVDAQLFAALLWTLAGKPDTEGGNSYDFYDDTVKEEYAEAMLWAANHHYVAVLGMPADFGEQPAAAMADREIMRYEIHLALYNYASAQGCVSYKKGDLRSFADWEEAESKYRKETTWLVCNGVELGTQREDGVYLDVNSAVTRGELVCLMDRFLTVIEAAE